MMQFVIQTSDEMIDLGKRIGSKVQLGDVLAMKGTLAAGKTTMTKGIAIALGITEPVTSPTFTLVSEYYGKMPLYHIDVYRLDTPEDFLDIGAEDLMYGNGLCVIEWSEKVQKVLPENTITIEIQIHENGSRTVTLENWNYGVI